MPHANTDRARHSVLGDTPGPTGQAKSYPKTNKTKKPEIGLCAFRGRKPGDFIQKKNKCSCCPLLLFLMWMLLMWMLLLLLLLLLSVVLLVNFLRNVDQT